MYSGAFNIEEYLVKIKGILGTFNINRIFSKNRRYLPGELNSDRIFNKNKRYLLSTFNRDTVLCIL